MTRTIHERFDAKIRADPETGCWVWTASTCRDGYGQFRVSGRTVRSHRFAFERYKGPIPDGLQVDHLCRNRACANPDHLDAVTPAENQRRAGTFAAVNAVKTECPQGHLYDEANTRIARTGQRVCHACRMEKQRRRRARMSPEEREARNAAQRTYEARKRARQNL